MRRRTKIARLLLFLALGLLTTLVISFALVAVDVQQGATSTADLVTGDEHWAVTRYDRAGAMQVQSIRRASLNWSPQQAAGPPNTPSPGDQVTAWASAGVDDQEEWLILDYAKSVIPRELHVYENCSPGALSKLSVFTSDGREIIAWTGKDPTPITASMGTSKIPIPLDVQTNRVKIYLDSVSVPGWNEVDAVGLIDSSGQTQWARKVTASSTYASRSSGASPSNVGNPSALIPFWCDLDQKSPAEPNVEHRVVDARGWPMLALYSDRDMTAGTPTQAAAGSPGPPQPTSLTLSGRSGVVIRGKMLTGISAVTTPGAGGPVPIPLRPIWTGVAINSAIYTLLWWGGFLALTLPRRFFREVSRFRQGCCIQCGYDLGYDFVNGCPECGWRRDPTTAATSRRELIASLDSQPNRH